MNLTLKMEILKNFVCQADFALAVNEHETKISQIIRGRRKLNPEAAERWLSILKCNPEIIKKVTQREKSCRAC